MELFCIRIYIKLNDCKLDEMWSEVLRSESQWSELLIGWIREEREEKGRKGWEWSKGGEHWGEIENLLQIKKIKFEFVK